VGVDCAPPHSMIDNNFLLKLSVTHFSKTERPYHSSSEMPFAGIRERTLCKLLTLHNPNFMSVFLRLGRLSRESVQVRGSLMTFVTNLFVYGEGLLGDYPLSRVRGCLFNIFTDNLPVNPICFHINCFFFNIFCLR
jgi:hypothetical protein